MTRRYSSARRKEHNSAVIAASLIGFLMIGAVLFLYFDTRGAPPEVLLLTAPGVALILGALYFWLRTGDWLSVDFSTRQATFFTAGKKQWSAPLDEIGPLALVPFRRQFFNGENQRGGYYRTEYQVVAGGARSVPLYAAFSYSRARRSADRMARDMKLGLRTLDGKVRTVDTLTQPIVRAQSTEFRPNAQAAALGPDAAVTVDERPDRTILRPAKSLRGEETPNILWLAGAGMAGLAASERNVMAVQLDPFADPGETALVAVLLIALAVTLGRFAYEAWRAILPGDITIDQRRVTYRGRSIPTSAIDEVVTADAIYFIAGKRHLSVPNGFCEATALKRVVQTLRALVVKHGTQLRH